MTTSDVVRGYHEARFRGDVAAAVALTATPFQFSSPMLQSDDPTGHLAGLPAFLSIVTGVRLLSELYGPDEATLVYDVHTASPVGTQRTAEHFRLTGGLITSITLIFDATPWQALRSAVVAGQAVRSVAGQHGVAG
ncbi:hypothetical protein Daura_15560 [Dactylosporangium aurantiacum]|uniref:SnoaL-like domain-containing protein n=1 Tax=Dactylosporangium aurantiacum TaxID=35754 RepID=A0A9Q9MI31_9ACTN|nr:hypothetical protein [Dactylosporangium aurantiacum]MDG6107777.1 hypothetical protein [Dactylosporangium aurantiacum]UWZ57444.1 hypothetical protein Daura_15560 [Dactylosporangium aurantiacum]